MKRVAKERYIPFLIALALFVLVLAGFSITGRYAEIQANSDLTPASVTYSPLGPQTGDAVTFTVTIKNIGGGSSDSSFKASLLADGSGVANYTVPALSAGSQADATFSWSAASGAHEISVIVDSDGAIAETNENNNARYETVGVDYPMKGQTTSRISVSNARGPTDIVLREYGSGTYDAWDPTLVYNGRVYISGGDTVIVYNASNVSQQLNISDSLTNIGEFAIYKGVLYTPAGNNRLYALNASNLSQSFGYFQKPGPVSQIEHLAFYRDYVYATSYENVYQLNASNISQRITNFSMFNTGYYFSLPAVYNGTVYVGSDSTRTLYALNASNVAQQLDSFTHGDLLVPHIYSPTIANGIVYVTGGNYKFWALNASNLSQVLSNITGVGQPDFGVPPTVWDDKVAYPSVTIPSQHTLLVFNASDVSKSLYNITVGAGGEDILWPAIVTNNGVLYFGSQNNVIYARNSTNLAALSSYTCNNDLISFAIGPDGTLYMPTATRLYALKQRPSVTPTGPADYTQVDRDGVNTSVSDVIALEARLENGASGVTVNFGIDQNAPTYTYSTSVSNTSVNGIARYYLNPGPSYYAGEYVWSPSAAGYNTNGSRYFNLYGGLNTGFKSNSTMPNTAASYQSGDTVEVAMNLTSMGPETEQDLFNDYNATANVTLNPPTESPITFALANRSDTTVSSLGSGTASDDCDGGGANDYVDFFDDLVPLPVPEGPWCGGPLLVGYNLGWTCDAATCPAESGKVYSISDADDSGFAGCGGSWNGLDFFILQGFDVTVGCMDLLVNGWAFNVTLESYDRYWYGNHTLATETGTWAAGVNATANYFFSNSTGRTFTVTGAPAPAPAPAPSGGSGIFRNITVEARNNIAIEAGANKLSLGRGTSEPIDIFVENTGSVVLQDMLVAVEGIPYDWVTITPSKIDSLGQNERRAVKVVINIPDYAGFGTYPLVFTVYNVYARAEIPIEVTVTAQCPQCPAPGEWTECLDGKQARAAYRCGSQTGYKCEPWAEEKECPTSNVPLLLTVTAIGAVVLQRFYFRKKPAAPAPQPETQPEEGQPSPAFQREAPSS